jgi:hypothetical protein
MKRWVWLLGGAIALAGAAAHAADGRIEINQHCATQTGCRQGDGAGFPVSTETGKSYVLTSSLTVTDADVTAINLADGASIDLNGFTIKGPAVCTGTPPSCVGLGSGRGVLASDGGQIRNGRITGMGGNGIAVGGGAIVENMLIDANGADGIAGSGAGNRIADCRIQRNKDDGIQLATASRPHVIQRTSIFGNGNRGVYALNPLIVDSAIYGNASYGVESQNRNAMGYSALFQNNGASGETSGFLTAVGPNVCDGGSC